MDGRRWYEAGSPMADSTSHRHERDEGGVTMDAHHEVNRRKDK